jgi:hypothetical protein
VDVIHYITNELNILSTRTKVCSSDLRIEYQEYPSHSETGNEQTTRRCLSNDFFYI